MRETIFDLISKDIDFYEEAGRINSLLKNPYKNDYPYSGDYFRIMNIVDTKYINWKYRGATLNTKDLGQKLDVFDESAFKNQRKNIFKFLLFSEYVLNIIYLFLDNYYEGVLSINKDEITSPILQNINFILGKLNYKYINIDIYDTKIIIIEDKPEVSAVIDKINNKEIALELLRYNHFQLKGNLLEKRKILTQVYKEFEELKYKLKDNKFEIIKNDLSGMFNNLDIRHTTNKDKNNEIHNRVNDMSDEELEKWYDRIYDMFLTAVLLCDYIDIKPEIKALNDKSTKE